MTTWFGIWRRHSSEAAGRRSGSPSGRRKGVLGRLDFPQSRSAGSLLRRATVLTNATWHLVQIRGVLPPAERCRSGMFWPAGSQQGWRPLHSSRDTGTTRLARYSRHLDPPRTRQPRCSGWPRRARGWPSLGRPQPRPARARRLRAGQGCVRPALRRPWPGRPWPGDRTPRRRLSSPAGSVLARLAL
jgi:hypothetical protein